MGLNFHQLCPRYSRNQNRTAPTAIRLLETFTFIFYVEKPFGRAGNKTKFDWHSIGHYRFTGMGRNCLEKCLLLFLSFWLNNYIISFAS